MGKRKDGSGRMAIEWLKERYLNGHDFSDAYAICDALRGQFDALRKCTPDRAAEWDRQARYELADAMVLVTQPVPSASYWRTPNASVAVRDATQSTRQRELVRRVRNQARFANAAAAQIDATRAEIRKAAEIDVALRILTQAVTGQQSLV